MPPKKHILFLTPGFPADEADRQCIPALQVFAKKMAEQKDIDLSIISLHYPQRHRQWQWYGLNVYGSFGRNRASIFFKAWQWIRQINRQKPIDIIHSFWLNDAAFLGFWAERFNDIKHIITIMGQDARTTNAYLRWLPLERLQTIALSDFHAQTYLQTTNISVNKIIPWGIEQPETPLPAINRSIDILGVGNLIPLKAFDQFIRIVKAIASSRTVRVEIIGDGPERTQLQQLVKDLKLEDSIHFCGKIDRKEVLKRMQKTKILLHPSTFESFGFVFLEALASGAYIVSYETGVAAASSRWLLARSKEELVKQCLFLLENELDHTALIPYPIENTVADYLACYAQIKK